MPATLEKTPRVQSGSGGGDRIRVSITDDHPAIREALARTIQSKLGMELCGEATSAADTLHLIEIEQPHVAIIDMSLPDSKGLSLVEQIRTRFPAVKVVVYSMHDENVYAEKALRAGAAGFLMKSEPIQELLEAVVRAYQGEIYLSREMASRILSTNSFRRDASPGFAIDDLTERERMVFTLLGEGYSIAEITERLGIEAKTVETYRRRAKEKLGLQSVGELLQYALRWTQG